MKTLQSYMQSTCAMRFTFKRSAEIAIALIFLILTSGRSLADPITWTTTITIEPNDSGAFMRLLHLHDGSWISAASTGYGSGNTYINLRRSTDDMRSWTQLTSVSESGRNLDNPGLVQLPNGNVLLTVRSVISGTSNKIEVWTATNVLQNNPFTLNGQLVDDFENPNSTNCPFNASHGIIPCGVWEPTAFVRSDGSILVFYADEGMQQQGYSQTVSEKVSTDGGQTWGSKIIAVSKQDNISRPGLPYITLLDNGQYLLSYEVGNSNGYYPGSYKLSSDGVTWSSGLGNSLPSSNGNAIAQSFSNGLVVMTSNSYAMYYSGDYGNTWTSMSNGLSSNSWDSMYQTRTNEIAVVYGPTLRLGTMAPLPYHDAFASNGAPDYSTYGGSWSASGGVYTDSNAGQGDKAMMVGNNSGGITGYGAHWRDYTVQADVRLHSTGNAGILVRASNPATGTDSVDGYYIGADSGGIVVLGNEAYGYNTLQTASIPGGVPNNTWIHLTATLSNCVITVTAQQLGSTNQANFSYNDSNCSHMNGTVGVRTFNTSADWMNVTAVQTGSSPSTDVPYLAPFYSGSASGWTPYGGSWSVANGSYEDTNGGSGDKSVVSAANNGNIIVQSDVDMTSLNNSPNSGILFGVSNPAVGVDSLDGFYFGTNAASLVLGYESYGWSALAFTPYESALSAGDKVHLVAQSRNCRLLVTTQPATQLYGYLQTYVYPNCVTTGGVGVRVFNAPTNYSEFSVLPN